MSRHGYPSEYKTPTPTIVLLSLEEMVRRIEEVRMAESQWCSACQEHLDFSHFARNRSRPRGLQTECRSCEAKRRHKRAVEKARRSA